MNNEKLLSIIVVSFKRFDNLEECLSSLVNNLYAPQHTEIIVVDNAGMEECRSICGQYGVRYVNAGGNLGVSGGRNLGIRESKGDYLFFIDDDAEVATKNYDSVIRDTFIENIGVIGLRVLNYFNGLPNKGELPFKQKNKEQIERSRKVSYFVGAGFALNRLLLDEIGYFPEDFFYGAEELDFSYRVLMNNWSIYYLADVTVLHKKSNIRITNKTEFYHILRNRFVIAAKYLPFPYYLINLGTWSLFMLYTSLHAHAFGEWKKGLVQGWKEFPETRDKAKILDKKTIKYLKDHEGRLWF